MTAPPEPDTAPTEERTPRRWKPFGDTPPAPRVGSRVPIPPPAPATPSAALASFPLWLPAVAALALGGVVAIIVALTSATPTHTDGPVAVGPPPAPLTADEQAAPASDPAVDPGELDLAELEPTTPDALGGRQGSLVPPTPYAFPRKLARPARGPYASRPAFDIEGPRRVGDLKPNPYWESIWGERRRASWRFERVGPLKANPYTGPGDD